ncbi:GPN-loop GTPase 2 [Tanacetum coccineum]
MRFCFLDHSAEAEETAVASRPRINCSGCAKGVKDGVWSGGHRSSRKVAVINLDPANDSLSSCVLYGLLGEKYRLVGIQIETFFERSLFSPLLSSLAKRTILPTLHAKKLTAIHLIDAHLCSDPGKYVSALLLSLSTLLHMELPVVNVLSKMDLIESYGKLAFNFDFYTDVEDLSYLQDHLDQDPCSSKYSTTAAAQEKYMKDDEVFDSDEELNNNEYGNSSAVEANSNSLSRT